jgi:hypothetical protein
MMHETMEPPMHGEEMAKIDETDCDINAGDREDNVANVFSDDYDDSSSTSEGEEEASHINPKDLRNLAEGKNLNNSFLGSSYPEPENWDHLHFDKGCNPQFEYLDQKNQENNIFDLAAKLFGLKK